MMGKVDLPLILSLVWDQEAPGKVRKTDIRVNIDLDSLQGPCGFLHGPWVQVHGGCITGLDVAAWPVVLAFCVSLPHFWVLLVPLTWAIFGFLSGNLGWSQVAQ